MKELLDKYIGKVFVSKGEVYIKFVANWHDETIAIYETDADCCSETWFADIIGVDALLGERVVGIEVMDDWSPDDNRTRQESDTAYGYKLKTKKGITDIIFRNSSNGYYGGGIDLWEGAVEPEGVEWVEITKDWSAPGSAGE